MNVPESDVPDPYSPGSQEVLDIANKGSLQMMSNHNYYLGITLSGFVSGRRSQGPLPAGGNQSQVNKDVFWPKLQETAPGATPTRGDDGDSPITELTRK